MANLQSVPANEEFKIEFDHEQGKHKPRLMHVELLKLRRALGALGAHGAYDNIEIGDIKFREDKNLLKFDIVAVTQEEALVNVEMRDDAYERPALHRFIADPLPVELSIKPKQEGGYAVPLPSIKHTIMVRCEEMSYSYEVEEPRKADLPLPASAERTARVRLRICYGRYGPPARDLRVRLAFSPGCKTPPGTLEPGLVSTDDEGRVEFGFTPRDLYYWPGGSYKQEIDVYAVTEKESRLEPLTLPLAPKIQLKLRAEKINTEIPDVDRFGLELLEQQLSQDPPHRKTSLKGTLVVQFSDPVTGQEFEAGVDQAKVEVEAFDGQNWLPVFVGDKAIKSDFNGQFTIEFPPLIEAYGDVGEPWEVHPQRRDLNYVTLTLAADVEFRTYESCVWRACPFDLLGSSLTNQIKSYRVSYHRQLLGYDPSRYADVYSALKLLGTGATGAGPYHQLFSAQYKYFLATWNELVSSGVNFAWNMTDMAGKIMGYGERAWQWLQQGTAGPKAARYLVRWGHRWLRPTLIKLARHLRTFASWLQQAIKSIGGGVFEDVVQAIARAIAAVQAAATQQCSTARAVLIWIVEAVKTVLLFIGRIVLMAISAVLWIAVRAAGAVCRRLGAAVGRATSHPEAVERARQALWNALAKDTTLRVTADKIVDLIEGYLEGKIKEIYSAFPRADAWRRGARPADLVRAAAGAQLSDLHRGAVNLGLPRDQKTRIDEYTVRYSANINAQFEGSDVRYWAKLIADAGDYIALIVQAAILIISGLAAIGTLGASALASPALVGTVGKVWTGIRAGLISLPVWIYNAIAYEQIGRDFTYGNARLMTA